MQSNMEKTAAWAAKAEQQRDPVERQADAAVAQVYASMVIADRLAVLGDHLIGSHPGTSPTALPDDTIRVQWWGDGE